MASLTIHISTPMLTAGQYFKERHRLLPAGAWSSVTNRTNAPFTISSLTPGEYEFEFILVMADGTHCAATYHRHTVKEFTCMNVTVVQEAEPYRIKISYTTPPGYTAPQCGIKANYREVTGGGAAVYHVSTNPFYIYPTNTTPRDLHVKVWADFCESEVKVCYDDDVQKPDEPACIPSTLDDWRINYGGQTGAYHTFGISLSGNQSTPFTTGTTIYIVQTGNNILPPYIAQSVAVPTPISQQPTYTIGTGISAAPTRDNKYYFDVYITDRCGKMHKFSTSYSFT